VGRADYLLKNIIMQSFYICVQDSQSCSQGFFHFDEDDHDQFQLSNYSTLVGVKIHLLILKWLYRQVSRITGGHVLLNI